MAAIKVKKLDKQKKRIITMDDETKNIVLLYGTGKSFSAKLRDIVKKFTEGIRDEENTNGYKTE
jgi:hypothetical protein